MERFYATDKAQSTFWRLLHAETDPVPVPGSAHMSVVPLSTHAMSKAFCFTRAKKRQRPKRVALVALSERTNGVGPCTIKWRAKAMLGV